MPFDEIAIGNECDKIPELKCSMFDYKYVWPNMIRMREPMRAFIFFIFIYSCFAFYVVNVQ